MASWKKMAEAFGRAFRRADDPTTVKSAGEVLAPAYELDPKTGEPLLDKPAGAQREAFIKGYEDAADIDRDYLSSSKSSRKTKARDRMHESADDARTDEALAKTEVDRISSELWNRAFMSAERDRDSKLLWHMIDDLRAKGLTESDILRDLNMFRHR